MQIILDADRNCTVVRRGRHYDLREFLEIVRVQRGMTKTEVQALAGLTHPQYLEFAAGKTKTPLSGLIAMQALGYEFYSLGGPDK